ALPISRAARARVALDLGGRRTNQPAAKAQGRTRGGRNVRQTRIARIAARRAREVALDDPVLERVEADDDETAAGREQRLGLRERRLERVELAIDRDPDRLKDARRRMDLRLAAARGPRDDVRERGRR